MQTRGLDRPAAVRVIVEGFFEPLIAELQDEALEELSARRRSAAKLAAAREDIEALCHQSLSSALQVRRRLPDPLDARSTGGRWSTWTPRRPRRSRRS